MQPTKSCACGNNEWIQIDTQRIESLGYEEVLWCKSCGTVKKTSKSNGAIHERTLDYRRPNLFEVKIKAIK